MVRLPFIPSDAEQRNPKPHIPDAQHGRKRLGNHGCPRGCRNAAAQYTHKQHIQHHIENRREDQEAQRRPAVSHALERIGCRIIQKCKGNAQKNDAQILPGQSQNVLRHSHELQKRYSQKHARHRQQQRKQGAPHHGGGQFPAQLLFIAGAEELAHDHRCPDAHA